ncbi:ATP-binding protein [Mucilaginibacter daejeonensis]|uniref:sensor histidine kinase n=1 Tax=Mucilaginibacter daejeonensis TaxID=398049 RepID=UPI001D174F8C|nr:HAMP domain-containing sensor histidine kinase [Mucilaginibacter daejeonensis]UEG51935.1 ATP-binding protein [Mucilaginibacter daejeonensis]
MFRFRLLFLIIVLVIDVSFDGIAGKRPQRSGTDTQSILESAKDNYHKGNYPEAMDGALRVYQAGQASRDMSIVADAVNLIGLVDLAQEQADIAIGYFKKAEQLNIANNRPERVAANLLNISMAQADLKRLDSAIYYVKRSLKISVDKGVKRLIAMGRNHLGEYYFKKKDLLKAEAQFMAVLNDKRYRSDWEDSFAGTGMAKIRAAQKRYRDAAAYADMAFQLAVRTGTKWDAAQALDIAHQAYRAMGDRDKAYQRLLAYKLYSDSLFDASKEKAISNLQYKERSMENDNLQKQITLVAQQRQIDRLIIAVILIALALLGLVAFMFYRRHQRTARNNQLLQEQNEAVLQQKSIVEVQNEELSSINRDNNRLLSIIGHDLRAPFAAITNTLDLFKSGDISEDELFPVVNALADQVNTASNMLDSTLLWAANQMGGVNYHPVRIDLLAKTDKVIDVLIAAARYKQIIIEHQKKDVPPIMADADQVRVMIHNLVSNAIKFTREHGLITISYRTDSKTIQLIIQDTGIGMPQDKLEKLLQGAHEHTSTYGTRNEKGIGLGLHLVKDFATNNGVLISGTSAVGQGTRFVLLFQIPDLSK